MTKFLLVVILLSCCDSPISVNAQIAKEPIDPCNKPEFCSTGTIVANPEDCTTYYWCVSGSWMKMNCSSGTVFDIVSMNCSFPGQATCQAPCPPFTGSTAERVIMEPAQIAKEPIDPCNKPEFCTTGTIVANPEDCDTYYWCVSGSWMVMNCSSGTVFDIVTMNCTFPGQATCQAPCPPFTGSTTERVTLQPAQLPKEPIDPCNKPEFCSTGTIVANPEDCTTYYWCVSGSWMVMNCSSGTVFDIVTMNCTWPVGATCQPACPPFTGSTTERVTLEPGTCDNITQCDVEGEKFPDQSNCRSYYLCTGGRLIHLNCSVGLVFDIYVLDCVEPDNEFDCYYRCVTPAPTTAPYVTSDSAAHASTSDSDSATHASGNNESSNEAVLIGIIIGVLLILILIIIVIVICVKKHKKNKVDPELPNANDEHKNPNLLLPVVMAAGDPGKATDFDHVAFIEKAEKEKQRGLKPFKTSDPSRVEAIQAVNKYKKKLRKELLLRYAAEEKHENDYYNDKLDLLKNDALVKQQNFRDELRLASERNDPTELTALANNHVNCQHANSIARQKLMNDRDAILRTRLKDMNLTQTDMVKAGLLASDLDGSEINKKIRRFNEEQEKMEEAYLQEFASLTASGASLEDLERLTDNYETKLQTLRDNHLQERDQATQRLLKGFNVLALQNLDKLWKQECQEVDEVFDYSATPDDDPGAVKVTLAQHLEALKKAGEEVDSHITNRNLAVAAVAKLAHDSRKSTPFTNDSVAKETTSTTKPSLGLPLAAVAIMGKNNAAGEFPDKSNAATTGVNDAREFPDKTNAATAGVNGTAGRSMPLSSETLEEEQRRILALHQQQVEHLQAMRTREKSKMDELLRKKLSERRSGARISASEV